MNSIRREMGVAELCMISLKLRESTARLSPAHQVQFRVLAFGNGPQEGKRERLQESQNLALGGQSSVR